MKKKKSLIIVVILASLLILAGGVFVLNRKAAAPSPTVAQPSVSAPSSTAATQPDATRAAFLVKLGARLKALPLNAIGVIAIPAVKINLPIFVGSSAIQIRYGAGTIRNNSMGIGNFSLASHHVFGISGSGAWLFSPLTGVKNRDMIYVSDERYVYSYKVDKLFIVDVHDVSILKDITGKKVITLVYCTDPNSDRRSIVRGTLIDKVAFAKVGVKVQDYFTGSWNQIPAGIPFTAN